ncbi:IS3 family transposase [Streptomyces sp. AC627_RSS907]|uniref:IS3 family transposase n=1 Tax=Streptomyces sp. AC627_RSS907 TaxID=2823684 RepID=UPI001C230194|nr:IS3 family transposase [Streptomyces sp. AC627_RSS907]
MTALVDKHPHLGAGPVLRELNIPSSTYYRWRLTEKKPCERRRRDIELTGRIRQVHDESGGIHGSPRVHAVLQREGVHVGRERVERLMHQAGLTGISPRRGKGFTRRDPDADHLCVGTRGTLGPDYRPQAALTSKSTGMLPRVALE